MPIYEYRCAKGHTFEVMQRITDDPVETCEVCGKPVARVLHPVAVHFKGSGFYNTDYGTRKRQRESAASEKDPAKSSDKAKEKSTATASSDGKGAKDAKPASDTAKKAATG